MKINQGDVFKVDLGYAGKIRYMVIVSRTDPDPPRALVLCAPITTKFRDSSYEVNIGKPRYLREVSFVNLQGVVAVQWRDLIDKVGRIESSKLEEIKESIRYTFDTLNSGIWRAIGCLFWVAWDPTGEKKLAVEFPVETG